jgi:uncharacterized protein YqjF (DUF2071 family)
MASALRMTWVDLAFLHWPVPADALRLLVPPGLEIDTFDGSAWVGVVPFEMRRVRVRLSPPIPTATDFPELNVRTYVRHRDRAGVYFFSLDAASRLAVIGARTWTGLRYFHAAMRVTRDGSRVAYVSRRTSGDAELEATYEPTGPVFTSAPGSFEHWSTERYSLFSAHLGALLRLDVEHPRWPLQRAAVSITRNTMAAASGISLPTVAPHVLFAARLDVLANWPQVIPRPATRDPRP